MAGMSKEDRVRERAHAIWESEGRPAGEEHRHWLEASAQIDAEDEKPAKKPAAKAKPAAAKPAATKPKAAKKAPVKAKG